MPKELKKNKIMKIFFDARRYTHCTTGVGRVIEGLLNTLVNFDQNNKYLILFNEKNPLPECKNPNFVFIKTDLDINSITINWKIPIIARKWGADVAYFPFWLAPLKMPCPTVVTIHDLLYLVYPQYLTKTKRLFTHIYTEILLKSTNRFQAVSQYTKNDLIKYYNIPEEKVDVIYNAVDRRFFNYPLSDFVSKSPRLSSLPKEYILYTGNHKPHKNLEGIIKTYHMISKQLESDLVIAGTRSNYQDPFSLPYLEQVKKLGIENRIHFIGQISDLELANVYNQAKFFVFPSLYEGFGIPPLEAMTCGIPVACSDIPPIKEILGDASVFFDPLDIVNMANQLTKLEKHPDMREDYKERGLQKANQYSWELSAKNWLDSLEKACVK
jgi:glycosyltransferase involved in cell wall biosynthesis